MRFTLNYALRQLAKSPGFTFIAVIMLALGIAMSTSTFSITNSVLLRSLPFPQSGQLVRIFRTTGEFDSLPHSPGNYLDIKSSATSFSSVAAFYPTGGNLAEPGKPPEQAYGLRATAAFFSTLGIQPMLGRGFSPDQDQPGKGNVMLLSHAYWQKRFSGNTKIIGTTLRVGIDQLTVIGILPPSFDETLLWYGVNYVRAETVWPNFPTTRNGKWYDIIARLKPGVSVRAAQPELTTISARLAKDYPADNAMDRLRVTDLASSSVDGSSRKLYWLVTGLAVSVLLIACANLASIQLARAFSRSHEFAVRAALGANRFALMGPLLAESLLLSAGGGILGLLLAFWANRLVSHFFTGGFAISMDGRVYAFAAVSALLTGLTFGLAPAWLASRVTTGDALKESSRGGTSGRLQHRLKYALIIGQLAFALVLVSAALSFGIAVKKALQRERGWQSAGLISGTFGLPFDPYKPLEKKFAFVHTLKAKLQQIPGIEQVSIATQVPIYGYAEQNNVVVEGAAPLPKGTEPVVETTGTDGDYFTLLKIPLIEGRVFTDNIRASDPQTVVINRTMARQFWPGQSAIGKRLRFTDNDAWCEIIGVVGDVRMNAGFSNPPSRLRVYRATEHAPSGNNIYLFLFKSSLPAASFTQPVRKAISDMDPDIEVQPPASVDQVLRDMLSGNDLMIITLGSFAFIGLLIALIGLYGVINQLTFQRNREIGIRIALGADYLAVVRLILGQSGRLLLGGVIVGLGGSYGVNRIYQQTMPELRLPGTELQIGITLLLCLVGLLACYFPARRASRIDPVVVLRSE